MKKEEIAAICDERLGKWKGRLAEEHATPVVLIGVGHEHHSGLLVVLTTEDTPNKDLVEFLLSAAHWLMMGKPGFRVLEEKGEG